MFSTYSIQSMRHLMILANGGLQSLQQFRLPYQLFSLSVRFQSVMKPTQTEQSQGTPSKPSRFSRLLPFGKSKPSTLAGSTPVLPQNSNLNIQRTGPTFEGRLKSLKSIGGPIRTCKPYTPPPDVPTQVFRIAQKVAKELSLLALYIVFFSILCRQGFETHLF